MIKIFIKAQLKDPSGRVVRDFDFKEAHSFVGNWIKALFVTMGGGSIGINNVTGGLTTVAINNGILTIAAAANVTTNGILIGSGTNPPTLGDYNLQTQITANVYHQIVNFFMNTPSASAMELAINRAFLNNTGSALTINEVGLVAAYAGANFLLDRTRYTIVVPIGLSICFTYKIGITL